MATAAVKRRNLVSSMCLTVKPVGVPDALIRHVRFDERGWETERCRMAQATAPILLLTSAGRSVVSTGGSVTRRLKKSDPAMRVRRSEASRAASCASLDTASTAFAKSFGASRTTSPS
jgi:hypothetical protein